MREKRRNMCACACARMGRGRAGMAGEDSAADSEEASCKRGGQAS